VSGTREVAPPGGVRLALARRVSGGHLDAGPATGDAVRIGILGAALTLAARLMAAQVVLPAELNADGMMTVRIGGHGQPDGRFVIDLGSGIEVLSSAYAQRVGRGSAGFFTGFRSTGERVDATRVRIAPIVLGPVTTPADAVVWPGLDADSIAGLISARTFARTPVTLDFLNRQLVFETPGSLAVRARRGVSLPLKTDAVRDMALDLFLDFDLGGGQVGTCEIDTGSQAIDMNRRFLAALGITEDSGAAGATARARLPGDLAPVGASQLRLARPAVRVGNYIYDCIIGTQFWVRTALTLDIPHHRVIVSTAQERR
jgi:PAS domain-containing protein